MGEISTSKKLANYLLENHDISRTQRGKIKVDDFTLGGNGVATRFLNTFIKPNRAILKEVNEDWLLLNDVELKDQVLNIFPSVMEALEDHVRAIEADEAREGIELPNHNDYLLEYTPVIDMQDPRGGAKMLDNATGRINPTITERAWERAVGAKHAKLMFELRYGGLFEYNPRDLEPHIVSTLNGKDITIYNTYFPPGHRIERNREAKLDQRFIDFLEGFFLDSCRSYAYNWLYHSTFKKMETYLVMVGAGGIGKNLLAEALKYVHGVSNFTKAPPSALDSKFNGHLVDSTMVYYDECRFSSDSYGNTTKKNRLKEWSNDYVPVEIKGVDAKNMDIYCSAIIATNNDSDVHLEQLDRKFSVMELTEERLEKRLGVETAQFLWRYIKEDDFPDAFLNWLEERINPDFNIFQEYKGEKFNQLVLSSLLTWQSELLFNFVLSGMSEKYSFKELKENIPYFPNSSAKVNDFLINFIWEGESLGKVVKDNGINTVIVNDKFKPIIERPEEL